MTIQEAIEARHSVRAYKDQPLSEEFVQRLGEAIKGDNMYDILIYSILSNLRLSCCHYFCRWPAG